VVEILNYLEEDVKVINEGKAAPPLNVAEYVIV
jgi:hypothetical protein